MDKTNNKEFFLPAITYNNADTDKLKFLKDNKSEIYQ